MAGAAESYIKLFPLNNGLEMPGIGLGTYRIRSANNIMLAVEAALKSGYRLFDTAAVYGNEIFLGEAFETLLPKYELQREDIFVTTKIAPTDHGDKHIVHEAYKKSLNYLGLDYVDMLLIHFPGTAKIPVKDPRNKEIRHTTWNSLCELYDDGIVNGIGVSNFTIAHLSDLLEKNPGTIPAINQVECHPYYQQHELLHYCRQQDIQLQAYCSLGGTSSNILKLIEEPVIKRIAASLDVTCSQLLLCWALQQDIAVIPKSINPIHIKQNICLDFIIPDDDMKEIKKLSVTNIKYAWDPTAVA